MKLTSRIFFIDERLLPANIITEAKNLVADIDFDDFAFVAITNYLNAILWTGDKILLNKLKDKGYKNILTTQELFTLIK